jgi:hypothetical protein
MKRLVETSLGPVLVDFFGDSVMQITLLDESGWEVKEGEWGDAELAKGLFYTLGIEMPEAEAIERELLDEYRSRGGSPQGKWDEGSGKATLILAPFVISIVAIFLLGLAAIGWLIYQAVS